MIFLMMCDKGAKKSNFCKIIVTHGRVNTANNVINPRPI